MPAMKEGKARAVGSDARQEAPPANDGAGRKRISDEEILREIYNAIVENRLPPGAKLGQDELGDVFGVSKTRIRPILHLLAQQKIVVIEPMRGAFVARPSVADARAVNSARQVVEEGVVRVVTRMATPRHIEVLRENVAKEQAARLYGESGHAHRLTGQFHCDLAAITGNQVVVDVVHELISRDSLVVAIYQRPNAVGCSISGHSELIDAIASGDEEAAATCMRTHLQEVIESLDLVEETSNAGHVRSAFRHLRRQK